MRTFTEKTMERSMKAEEGRGGRIWRETPAAGVGERGHRRRLGKLRFDSLQREVEDAEAVRLTVAASLGVACSAGEVEL
jgi:hypothetical protein